MTRINVKKGNLTIKDKVTLFYEQRITTFGNAAKLGAPKRYIGKRAVVVILEN
ncbi:DUF2080 family transposase-associated protein [Candidatus Woesearchaeota archaeon]|nr:DUF2080 family transposase-associated protein [Candidatus Woesearchaeota archaeon]